MSKPKFPRWFCHFDGPFSNGRDYIIRCDSDSTAFFVYADEEVPAKLPDWLDYATEAIDRRIWRELTEDEAKAMMNKKG